MIGEKLGRYTLMEILGTGSLGAVYKAEDGETGRLVAIKVVKSNVLFDVERRERFLQGLLAASEIKHSSICPVLEIGDDDNDFFVVMPLLRGHKLAEELRGGPIEAEGALDIAIQIGSALEAAHALGTVHRALNPSNVWVQLDGPVMLTDCSLARFTEIEKGKPLLPPGQDASQTDTLIPPAALAYMSPEQVSGRSVDYRTDIFSLGVLLYEMLTGRHPFEARNSLSRMSAILGSTPAPVRTRHPRLSAEVDSILARALAKAPEARHQSISELVQELRRLRDQYPLISRETAERSAPRVKRLRLRHLYWMAAGLALALILFWLF